MMSIASPNTSAGIPPITPNASSNVCLNLADELPAHPELGRIVPELADPNVRERFLYSYRLVYELTEDEIHILAVIHGKRLRESLDRFNR
jgi:toxin ParE1/3/4